MVDRRRVKELVDRLQQTEEELYKKKKKQKKKITCDFSKERIGLWKYIINGKLSYALSAPVIYSMIIPAVILDIFVTIYQAICFPIYKIPKVCRKDYIVIDRYKLPYLNILQKLNCLYCAYFNGLINYVREISIRTEQFWCPIQHSRRIKGVSKRYWDFLQYGEGEDINKEWEKIRQKLYDYDKQKEDKSH